MTTGSSAPPLSCSTPGNRTSASVQVGKKRGRPAGTAPPSGSGGTPPSASSLTSVAVSPGSPRGSPSAWLLGASATRCPSSPARRQRDPLPLEPCAAPRPGRPVLRVGLRHERIVAGPRPRHERQRQRPLTRLPVPVGAHSVKLEVAPTAADVDAGPERLLPRARDRGGAGILQGGRHQRRDAHAPERPQPTLARLAPAPIRPLRLPHDDEKALPEVRGPASEHRPGGYRLESALRHLHQYGGVPQRVEEPFVHHAHVVVPPHRRDVAPLRNVELL